MDALAVEAYQDAATRIVARYLEHAGMRAVQTHLGSPAGANRVDVQYERFGSPQTGKVKPDAYCGTDGRLVADRDLPFYRADGGFAFEMIADAITREDGWAVDPQAEVIYYYRLALGETEQELVKVAQLPDEKFFSRIQVVHDDLFVIPSGPLSTWLRENGERYISRPVDAGDHTAWYKVVPRGDVEEAVPGVERPGPVFATLT